MKSLKDIDVQKLAQMTEYFLMRDMDVLAIFVGQIMKKVQDGQEQAYEDMI